MKNNPNFIKYLKDYESNKKEICKLISFCIFKAKEDNLTILALSVMLIRKLA